MIFLPAVHRAPARLRRPRGLRYGDGDIGAGWERLEVRAFGVLLEELVTRYDQRVDEFDQARRHLLIRRRAHHSKRLIERVREMKAASGSRSSTRRPRHECLTRPVPNVV